MSRRQMHPGALIAGAITLVYLGFFYYAPFLHPGDFLFNLHGDGLANYFSFAWHIRYDSNPFAFGGMNYPYGEYLPYVDCHPALASILGFLLPASLSGPGFAVGLLNLLMLLSPAGAAVFLYLIMRRFQVPQIGATMMSPAIALLSSQVLLMQFGHYALAQSVFFPLSWLLLLRYEERPEHMGRAIAVIGNMLFWTFTHNYLGAIVLFFTSLVHVYRLIWPKGVRSRREVTLRLLQILVPVFLMVGILILLDPHDGRIEMPFEPSHTASLYTVLFPRSGFTHDLVNPILSLTPQTEQSWGRVGNYVGLPVLLCLIAGLVMWVVGRVRRKNIEAKQDTIADFRPYGLSALLLLFFSMGLHFKLTGAGWLEYVPVIKQFVGLGRFAWAFYYVAGVYAAMLIGSIANRKIMLGVYVLSAAVMCFEAVSNHAEVAEHITETPNILKPSDPANAELQQMLDSVDLQWYQAIVPVPFYHKYVTPSTFPGSDTSVMYSMQLSYLTGLPLVSAVLSRPSVREGRNILQMFSPPQYAKDIAADMPDERSFLMLYTGESLHPLEKAVFDESEPLTKQGRLQLTALAHQSIFHYNHEQAGWDFLSEYEHLQERDHDWRTYETDAFLQFEGFDKQASDQVYRGGGAWSGDLAKEQTLFTSTGLKADLSYELSFWYYNHLYDQLYNRMWIEERDVRDSVVQRQYFSPTANPLSDGDWFWNAYRCGVKTDGNRLLLRSQGSDRYASTFYVDEILLRDINVDAERLLPGQSEVQCIRNNRLVARMRR